MVSLGWLVKKNQNKTKKIPENTKIMLCVSSYCFIFAMLYGAIASLGWLV
jgi:hypothetical protein